MNYAKLCEDLTKWIKEEVESANLKGAVFGISGGIDSAVLACLCKKAFGDNALGLIMPIKSDPKDEEDARTLAKAINLKFRKVDLNESYDALIGTFEKNSVEMAASNIKPRLRMITLYYYAQNNEYMVLSGSNRSEFMTGYFTKYGDSGADLMPLLNLYKTDIFEMAKVLGIPDVIINKKPSAGLWEGQTDEDEFGFTYEELDNYLMNNSNTKSKDLIDKKIKQSEHKRNFAKSFEFDRRNY
ncbi:MAG: NAD+ synthase [Finegoldia magna]|uniref:NAD+ synthase n=1 Tax=Finegoldia magna TaxID=1260 RepID=UPI000B916683|nr:NAD+ synthase [Finegoldia magna]OXZ30759.1 NAD(+) synthetase [Finegoldia magna]